MSSAPDVADVNNLPDAHQGFAFNVGGLNGNVRRVVNAFAVRHPKTYAGSFEWRSKTQRRTWVGFTQDAERNLHEIRNALAPLKVASEVHAFRARYSRVDLDHIRDAIDHQFRRRSGGLPFGMGIDDSANRVEIDLVRSYREPVVRELQARFGVDALCFVRTGPAIPM